MTGGSANEDCLLQAIALSDRGEPTSSPNATRKMPQVDEIQIIERLPSVEEYLRIRAAVGWLPFPADVARRGLDGSLYSVCAVAGGELVGHGRIVGDGAIYFYVQDVAVVPRYQRRGVGARVMEQLMRWVDAHAPSNAFIGLMAASGVAPFYHAYGFKEREDNQPGMFKRIGADAGSTLPRRV